MTNDGTIPTDAARGASAVPLPVLLGLEPLLGKPLFGFARRARTRSRRLWPVAAQVIEDELASNLFPLRSIVIQLIRVHCDERELIRVLELLLIEQLSNGFGLPPACN